MAMSCSYSDTYLTLSELLQKEM